MPNNYLFKKIMTIILSLEKHKEDGVWLGAGSLCGKSWNVNDLNQSKRLGCQMLFLSYCGGFKARLDNMSADMTAKLR